MKISFDLDDTIIPGSKRFQTAKQTSIQKLLRMECIRIGTIELFKKLKQQNHEIGIYTTSFRSYIRIKLLFLSSGFSLDFIINQKRNLLELNKANIRCSKYPPAFNIDLHVTIREGLNLKKSGIIFKRSSSTNNSLIGLTRCERNYLITNYPPETEENKKPGRNIFLSGLSFICRSLVSSVDKSS